MRHALPFKSRRSAAHHGWDAPRTRGAVAASDAFFPFADGLEVLSPPRPPPLFNQVDRCAMMRSLPPPTQPGSLWCLPACGILTTKDQTLAIGHGFVGLACRCIDISTCFHTLRIDWEAG
ncbi:MAG: hypothetical protein CM15mP46_2040 [Alphaproteobacteria bacterium]|nr:MAG: hypothetical protein CM15mP46_2040 [Alphaproteobacteria bacterium]